VFDFLLGRGKNDDRAASADVGPHPAPSRPAIGLALGGGAARGFAHIGVIRTLLAKGIVPDVIAGTSIGAVVGALYATGHLDPFEEWGRSLTRRGMLGYLDLSFFGSGIINGERLAARLEEQIAAVAIEDMPLRFAAIATELGTGHEIWLTRGRLVDALRATYALPGIFTPILIGHRWLVDGALVNPVPVSAARALGARLVIAVNLNSDLIGRGSTIAGFGGEELEDTRLEQLRQRRAPTATATAEELVRRTVLGTRDRPGLSTIMIEAFNIMQDRITRARLAGDPPDVMISPRLRDIALIDFHRASEAIERGAEAAERALAPIEEALAALT
jgi:NTE family protein